MHAQNVLAAADAKSIDLSARLDAAERMLSEVRADRDKELRRLGESAIKHRDTLEEVRAALVETSAQRNELTAELTRGRALSTCPFWTNITTTVYHSSHSAASAYQVASPCFASSCPTDWAVTPSTECEAAIAAYCGTAGNFQEGGSLDPE